jgi:signal transduction histidine kinase
MSVPPMRLLPDSVFGRTLVIVLACIAGSHGLALLLAPDEHRSSLLGALLLLVPPVVIGVFAAARSVTRPLSQLIAEADGLGRGVERVPMPAFGPREVRRLSTAFEAAQERMSTYVGGRVTALAAISHDLKIPLTRMRLRVESLDDESVRTRLSHDLDELSEMVHSSLLALKDLSDGESEEAIDMNVLLARLQSEFAEMGRGVAVTGQARRPYFGRVRALKRCLTNLIDNAVKFGEGANVTLEDGQALRVRVADHGPGIPDAELDRVFRPFYRTDTALAHDVEGTGLGLGIARDIIHGHGGRLTLRNRAARGLEAEIVLPRHP